MNRIVMPLLCALVVLLFPMPGSAEQGASGSAGLRFWSNDWKRETPKDQDAISSAALLVGPDLLYRAGDKVLFEGKLLFPASKYEFTAGTPGFTRMDIEVSAGIIPLPEVVISGGYRQVRLTANDAGMSETLTGAIAGVQADIPADRVLLLHAAVQYHFARSSESGPAGSSVENSPGWIAEIAIGFRLGVVGTAGIGYRSEIYRGRASGHCDSFSGPLAVLTAAF